MIPQSEYSINNIVLISCSFKRNAQVDFDSAEFHNNVSFKIDNSFKENILNVLLTVTVNSGTHEDKVDVESEIQMLGTFTKNMNVNQIDVETFGTINAPAIIFPYIREQIASLSVRAGIPAILLPPVNFVQLSQQNIDPEQ